MKNIEYVKPLPYMVFYMEKRSSGFIFYKDGFMAAQEEITIKSQALARKKRLSIIIPFYNVEKYALKTAASIVSQEFNDFEIILVDDGSTDKSSEFLESGLRELDVTVIHQKNEGPGSARNAGIRKAVGEYILFIDGDDFLLPDALTSIWEKLKNEKPDILFGRYIRWRTPDKFISGKQWSFSPPHDIKDLPEYMVSSVPEPIWNVWRYVVNREYIERNNLHFETGVYCEDIKWTLTLLENVKSISFLDTPFYAYNDRRPDSIMNTLSVKRVLDLNDIVQSIAIKYYNRPIIVNALVFESFFYINEYCTFSRNDRKDIYESYKGMFLLYKEANSLIIKLAGKCRGRFMFYMLSIVLFVLKYTRRFFLSLRQKDDGYEGETAYQHNYTGISSQKSN